MSKISVVINTYNASQHLVKVLDSLRDFDEIVVCDMESCDNTLEIAINSGCRIVTFPRKDNNICEAARDFAIHQASNPWVLVVDADEIVTPQLREYLYSKVALPNYDTALLIPRLNLFMGKPVNDTPDYQLRFFLRDRTTWPATIHSRPHIDGPVKKIPRQKRDLWLRHLDDSTITTRIEKLNRYTDNELPKRENRHFGVTSMLFRPLWFFLRTLIIGGAWRSGRRGIARSYISAIYQMTLLSKLAERDFNPNDSKNI